MRPARPPAEHPAARVPRRARAGERARGGRAQPPAADAGHRALRRAHPSALARRPGRARRAEGRLPGRSLCVRLVAARQTSGAARACGAAGGRPAGRQFVQRTAGPRAAVHLPGGHRLLRTAAEAPDVHGRCAHTCARRRCPTPCTAALPSCTRWWRRWRRAPCSRCAGPAGLAARVRAGARPGRARRCGAGRGEHGGARVHGRGRALCAPADGNAEGARVRARACGAKRQSGGRAAAAAPAGQARRLRGRRGRARAQQLAGAPPASARARPSAAGAPSASGRARRRSRQRRLC